MSLIVKTDEVLARHIKAVKVINRILRIVDVIIDYECSALGLACHSPKEFSSLTPLLSDLSDRTVLAEDIEELLRRDLEGKVSHEDDPVNLRRKPHLQGDAIRFLTLFLTFVFIS